MHEGGRVKVSILESQQLFREQLVRLFEEAGFEVVGQYGEPAEFLAHVVEDAPDVAVADVGPQDEEDSGLSWLRTLQALHPQVRLLVLSAGKEGHVEACYREGAYGFLDATQTSTQSMLQAVEAVARGEKRFPLQLLPSLKNAAAAPRASPLLSELSTREKQVLSCVAAGADNLKIATLLQISERTVKAHMSKLYQKLGSENRTQLALLALQCGLRPASDV